MTSPKPRVTKAEKRQTVDGRVPLSRLAELFQMSERGVRMMASKGVIPKGSEGLWHEDACIMGYIAYLRQYSQGRRPDDHGNTDDRTRLLRAKADIQEMEANRMADRLVEIEHIEKTFISVVAAMKARLLAIPTRAATLLPGEKDPDVIQEQVETLIHEALAELSEARVDGTPEDGGDGPEAVEISGSSAEADHIGVGGHPQEAVV